MRRISRRKKGFTLVEVAVVMPMVVLMIGAMIGVIIFLSNSSLRSQGRSKLQVEVLSALDRMEQDIKTSTSLKNTGSTTSDLTLTALATDMDPISPTRKLIRESDCAAVTTALLPSEALAYEVRYQVSGTSLIRTVTMTKNCSSAWQKNGTQALIQNVTALTLSVVYPITSAASRDTASITLAADKLVGGQQVQFTGVMYARSTNIY